MTKIKFCGMVRAEDLMFAAGLGVDYIGLVLYAKSPRALSLEDAASLRRLLPSHTRAVGLFVNAHPQFVLAAQRRLGLDLVQFHGDESLQTCLESTRSIFWRAVRMTQSHSLEQAMQAFSALSIDTAKDQTKSPQTAFCQAYLVDADAKLAYGGSGHVFDWSWLGPDAPRPERLILSGGLTPENVSKALPLVRPWAVDVSSGIQGASPRLKDAGKMEAFVNAVRTFNHEAYA